MNHVKEEVNNVKIDEFHARVESTIVLYQLQDKGMWIQFVRNRTMKIKEHNIITWHYKTHSRKSERYGKQRTGPEKLHEFWYYGPKWLANTFYMKVVIIRVDGPEQPEIIETEEARKERLQKKLKKG